MGPSRTRGKEGRESPGNKKEKGENGKGTRQLENGKMQSWGGWKSKTGEWEHERLTTQGGKKEQGEGSADDG